jgi:ParB family transcriptional regulator, chromosome partitioning protein
MSNNSSRFFGIIEDLNISDIILSPYNLRVSTIVEVKEMADSIKEHGLIQPIVVRPKENHFEIIAGCRRYLACKSLCWKKITCHVVLLNDVQMFEVSLIENIERKSLTPLEEANAFRTYVCDNGWGSIADLASKIGKSSSYITKRIGLLNLPDDVLEAIKNSSLNPSSAEELLSVKDNRKQSHLGGLIVKRRLSTKQVRDLVKNDPLYCENSDITEVRSELQSFSKSIVALRIAMNRLGTIIEDEEDNWLIYEFLMYQKKILHNQIDIIMKAKRKYSRQIFRYRKILEH